MQCDLYGNEITNDGFYDQNGAWQDLSNFEPNPLVVEVVEYAIESTADMNKEGQSVVDPNEDFYSEEDAEELSNFDIEEWLDS